MLSVSLSACLSVCACCGGGCTRACVCVCACLSVRACVRARVLCAHKTWVSVFDECVDVQPSWLGPVPAPTTLREKRNWLIHLLYVRQDFTDCMLLIEAHVVPDEPASHGCNPWSWRIFCPTIHLDPLLNILLRPCAPKSRGIRHPNLCPGDPIFFSLFKE